MLNPIIYVTFHQDFRRAFKYLLCLQCSTMGSRLRAEAYISQYGGSLGHLNNSNGGANGTNKSGVRSTNKNTLRANASWGQLDEKVVHFDSVSGKSAGSSTIAQVQLQSSSTVPLLSSATKGCTTDSDVNPREYELQSITTAPIQNQQSTSISTSVTPVGGGIPVSLLLTTTFALTNTTTTTSAQISLIPDDSSSPVNLPQKNGNLPGSDISLSDHYVIEDEHRNSLDTIDSINNNVGYNISIQIDPNNHEATITRNTLL